MAIVKCGGMQKMVPIWKMKNMQEKVIVLNTYVKKWIKENVIFNKAAPFISGLVGVHAWVESAVVGILITHMTDNNWLNLPKAAAVVNVQDGLTAPLVIVVAYASNAYMGPFKLVVYTTIAYIMGLLVLFLAAWRLQNIEIHLIYVGILLIALGRAGRDIVLKEFLADQFRGKGSVDEIQVEKRRKVWWRLATVVGIIVSISFPTDALWVELSKISTIIMGAAFGFFLVGIPFYERKKPAKPTPDMTVLRVLCAAITNIRRPPTPGNDHISDIPILRWLDKAAIKVESSPTSHEEQERKGKCCTVEEVEEVKILLTMTPLWTTFLVYGVLQATGNTFFYEQANYMDDHLGIISHVPVNIFLVIMTASSFIASRICDFLFSFYWRADEIPRKVMLARIGIGMSLSPICCIIAWRVEHYRLRQYVEFDTHISIFWLLPQFMLLGVMEGLVSDGLEEFFYSHVPESFYKYGPSMTQFALNIGHFLSLAFILIFHGLFGDDLDASSLGTYYMILGYICFVNLVFYFYVSTFYVKEHPPQEIELLQPEEQEGHLPLAEQEGHLPLAEQEGHPPQEIEPQKLEEQLPEEEESFEDNNDIVQLDK